MCFCAAVAKKLEEIAKRNNKKKILKKNPPPKLNRTEPLPVLRGNNIQGQCDSTFW